MAAMTDGRLAVIVFAKPPRPGQAKTRLAAVLGDATAAELARAFVVDTWSLVGSLEWADPILATTDIDDPFWSELPGATVWAQGDGDLGDRMERALRRALETHDAAVVIGSDVPGVPVAALNQARAALKFADVVIGPSEDGGYYLIGFRAACPHGAFAGVEWSTSHTRADTKARLRSLGLAVVKVTPWFDVDEVDDLHRLRHLGDRLRRAAPETARVLDTLMLAPSSSS
jgi:rSAM/selenodomain-associated transferase 1